MSTDRLFKIGSFEQELAVSMGKQLVAHQHQKQIGFDRRATKAVDLINTAAQLFDEAGFHNEAEALTRVLEKMAGKKTAEAAPLTWDALSKEEQDFYHSLSSKQKGKLKQLIGDMSSNPSPDEFINMIKLLHAQTQSAQEPKEPESFEMESVLPNESDVEAVPGADVIEMKSLAPELAKKKVLSF